MDKITFVMKDIGRSGGAKNIYEILSHLSKDYNCELVYLSGSPGWYGKPSFQLTNFGSVNPLIEYLRKNNSINVATWWETADWVARSGGGYYLVQDIESSYYSDNGAKQRVLETYKLGLKHLTINNFQEMVLKLVYNAPVTNINLAIDHEVFKPKKFTKENAILYCYRDHPLKNPNLFRRSIEILRKKTKDTLLYTYGMASCSFANYNYLNLKDSQLVDLMNKSKVYVSTSVHEGFCMPILEAMACGLPVVTTKSNGNMTFCIDNVNCLIAETENEIAECVLKIINNDKLADRISKNAILTAGNYTWDKTINKIKSVVKLDRVVVKNIPDQVPPKDSSVLSPEDIFIKRDEGDSTIILTRDGRKFVFPKGQY